MNISYRKNLFSALFLFSFFFIFVGGISAAPNFSFSPSNSTYYGTENFVIDVMIDSDGASLVQAKAVVLFDPTYMQLVKAESNNALFLQYPDDQQTTDNTNGVIMLTGFTQSGTGDLYVTDNSPDVFARLTFHPLWDGEVDLDWNFTGDAGQFETSMIEDGSPPQNILIVKPEPGRYILRDTAGPGKEEDDDDDDDGGNGVGNTPETGIFDNKQFIPGVVGIAGGIMLFTGSGIYLSFSNRMKESKFRTIVNYEERDE